MKSCAPGLALKKRHKTTRKLLIVFSLLCHFMRQMCWVYTQIDVKQEDAFNPLALSALQKCKCITSVTNILGKG